MLAKTVSYGSTVFANNSVMGLRGWKSVHCFRVVTTKVLASPRGCCKGHLPVPARRHRGILGTNEDTVAVDAQRYRHKVQSTSFMVLRFASVGIARRGYLVSPRIMAGL